MFGIVLLCLFTSRQKIKSNSLCKESIKIVLPTQLVESFGN